jgi:nitroreductase
LIPILVEQENFMSLTSVQSLATRRSVKFVSGPGPSQDELDQILQAAMSAPDHGGLVPWRFKLIRGDAVARLGDVALDIVKASGDPRMTPEKEKSTRAWLAGVPLIIAVAQRLNHDNKKIPESEQLLATGAAVMNILNATHFLGYAAYWSTGLGTYNEAVQDALGFDSLDYRFLGFLAIGTPVKEVLPAKRAHFSEVVTEWTGTPVHQE